MISTKKLATRIGVVLFVLTVSLIVFGFLGPALISAASSEAVILGYVVLIVWPLTALLVIYNKIFKQMEKNLE